MSGNEIAGCRILVVEDDLLIAVLIEDALQDSGGEIVGPAATLEKALKLVEEEEFDAAILDVTLRGAKVYPVAELLLARGIPFVFASGYGDWALPEELRDKPRLMKPFTAAALEEQIGSLCGEGKSRRARGGATLVARKSR
jgi:two-component SAPR family response regulator